MDGEINKSVPDISGARNGVYISNGVQFDFYDGIIKGSSPIEGNITNTEPGYKINISTVDNVNAATLTKISTVEAIAQVSNLYFNNLQQAINACKAGGETIKILVEINLSETLNVAEGQNVTIDLMGNTLTVDGIENIIENHGTLTIIDSVGGGSINGQIDNHGQLNQ